MEQSQAGVPKPSEQAVGVEKKISPAPKKSNTCRRGLILLMALPQEVTERGWFRR